VYLTVPHGDFEPGLDHGGRSLSVGLRLWRHVSVRVVGVSCARGGAQIVLRCQRRGNVPGIVLHLGKKRNAWSALLDCREPASPVSGYRGWLRNTKRNLPIWIWSPLASAAPECSGLPFT
jgi:hypothetical protein